MKNYRRLPPGCAANARDLGGYPAEDDGITGYGVFVRSDLPGKLDRKDMLPMDGYGSTRGVSETTSSGIPDRFVE